MRRRRLGFAMAMAVALALPVCARAQESAAPPAAKTLVRATATRVALQAGGSGVTTVHLEILPGWHVNANPPALDYNIPTRVSLAGALGVTAGTPGYPAPEKKKFAFEDQELWVWDGGVDVSLPLHAAADAVNGAHVLTGRVDYQSCNDQVCLAPTSVSFTVAVTVTGGAAHAAATGAPPESATTAAPDTTRARPGTGFVTAPPPGGGWAPGSVRDRLERAFARGGIAWLLALFGGGLLLNLTPCVFPMLGITVSIFGARRRERFVRFAIPDDTRDLITCSGHTALPISPR